MSYIVINGGKKLSGSIENQSAKNSAVAILCACAAIKGITTLVDMPEIEEVKHIIELLQSIGIKIKWLGKGKLQVDASGNINMDKIDPVASEKTRASIFLWGALAGRVKSYKIPKSGGCHLGERTVRPHWYALQKLGVEVVSNECFYIVKNSTLKGAKIIMYESGDTTTENTLMAAVLAEGKTVIKMASANYMVQDLCYFLIKAGAKIKGVGTTTLEVEGVKNLKPVTNYSIMPDPIVAMTYIAVGITTGSNITVKSCPLEFLELELCKLEVMGQKYKIKNERKSKNGKFTLVDIETIPSKLVALQDKIYGRPFPGLNIDNLPLFIPILTQAVGRTLVHDWAYENRAVHALELQKLGAQVTLLDAHRLWVEGPIKFVSNEVICPPALRPAVNILICMLAANGKSVLRNTYAIERGYENLYQNLNSIGADIKIINE